MPSLSPSNSSRLYYSILRLGLPVIAALFVVILFLPGQRHHSVVLGKYAAVPPFSLTERSGKTITNHDLEGKIWVADFIFTTCPGPCPIISANMARLQQKLAGDNRVQLVSFTVDPQDDTPAVLAAYADHLGADPQRWWFLTGPEKPLYDLIHHGFLQTVEDNHGKQLQPGQYLVTHSTSVVLVDPQGFIRGIYNGLNDEELNSLFNGIRQLENE
ncbi:MAG: SCO family protein [Methylacidiphilales bacterium]|nr:SCO family protein [Candidatus Methylacidiphilales bacterium]